MMVHDSDLLTSAEVAQITRVPESTVRYWRYLGTGPSCFRVGKRVLYRRREVHSWIALKEADVSEPLTETTDRRCKGAESNST